MTNTVTQNQTHGANIPTLSTTAALDGLPDWLPDSIRHAVPMYLSTPGPTPSLPVKLNGADARKFFGVDWRIAELAIEIGNEIKKPAESLAMLMMIHRGAQLSIGLMSQWGPKAGEKYAGIRRSIGKEIQARFIQRGIIGAAQKIDGATWYAVNTWAEINGLPPERASVVRRHTAFIARALVDGEQVNGGTVDKDALPLKRILNLGARGTLRVNNADALVWLIAMHVMRDPLVSGGVSPLALYAPFNEGVPVAARQSRRAWAFEKPKGKVVLDQTSPLAAILRPLIAASGGTLSSGLEKVIKLGMLRPVIVAMNTDKSGVAHPLFAFNDKTARKVSESVVSYIETPPIHGSQEDGLDDMMRDELEGKLVLPFMIDQVPSLREAYIPAFTPNTALMRRMEKRFQKQNAALVNSVAAIDEIGGLKAFGTVLEEVRYG